MKILTYTTPARGHLFPLVPILDELARRGHGIAVRTLASEVPLMAARGFEAAPIAPAIEAIEHDDYLGRTPPGKIKRAMATFGARSPHEVDDLRAAIDDELPDAILVDCMAWGATAVAEAWGGPWAQWFPYPLPLSSRDAPPFGPGLKPAAGWPGRLRDRIVRPIATRAMVSAAFRGLNAMRASVGVPGFTATDDMFTVAPLLLYMTAEPFEYPRSDWPPSVRMVGPCCWDPPADPPAWLAEVEWPLVLVSTSSEFQDDGRLVRTALEALANEDVQVVATLPSAEAPTAVPANARLERFVPHPRSSPAPPVPSRTVAPGRRRRRWRPACPYASSRSDAISSRSPAASRWPARERDCPRSASTRSACDARCARRWPTARAPAVWPRASRPRAARPRQPTRSRSWRARVSTAA
jgi:UDP:flavonoid glycosyltransferase YjiC (YdhE family)